MIENLDKKAKKFAKALKYDITYPTVKEYAEKQLGYNVLFIGTKQAEQVIRDLELERVKKLKAFTYKNITSSVIFLSPRLDSAEKLTLLLHEISHILLGHLDVPSHELDDKESEEDANMLSCAILMQKSHQSSNGTKNLCIVLSIALVISLGVNIHHLLSTPVSDNSTENLSFYTSTSNLSEQYDIVPSGGENYVCVTAHGEKYHTPSCTYVRNKSNVVQITREQAEEQYEPCKVCLP